MLAQGDGLIQIGKCERLVWFILGSPGKSLARKKIAIYVRHIVLECHGISVSTPSAIVLPGLHPKVSVGFGTLRYNSISSLASRGILYGALQAILLTCLPKSNTTIDAGSEDKSGTWFRRVEEAADQYMKRRFVTEKEQVAKRRALKVQTEHQLKTSLNPRTQGPGRGGSRVEEGIRTAS